MKAMRLLPALLALLAPVLASADAMVAQPRLSDELDALIAEPRFAAARWGVQVVSLDSGRVVYAYDADHLFTPASTAKLFTGALALATLGAEHRIPTVLYATGRAIRDGRLRGDLVLYGYGDPTLGADGGTAWADGLAQALRRAGVSRVQGDLVGDDSLFAAPATGSGWEVGDLLSGFAAPASALSVGENLVEVRVAPASAPDALARIAVSPETAAPRLDNRLRTGAADDVNLYRAPGDDTLHAFGTIPRGSAQRVFRLAVADPALAAANALAEALRRSEVALDGRVRAVHWPQRDRAFDDGALQRIGEVWSPPVSQIVRSGLKRSQNLYLQNLLLIVGVRAENEAGASGQPVTFRSSEAWGIVALNDLLRRAGIDPAGVRIEDGAGLSRRNLVTPAALTGLLAWAATQPWAEAFVDALPVAGVDGSLGGRLRGGDAQGRVRAKTGSMANTAGLAGYVTTRAGERLAFAALLNNYVPPADSARRPSADLDALAERLAALAQPTAAQPAPADP